MITINMNHVAKNYGFNPVLKDVNLEIMSGERTAIVGRNGSGKTSLFKMITGEETPDKGTVSIRKGATIGYLEQIPILLEGDMSVEDVLNTSFTEIKEFEKQLNKLEGLMSKTTDSDKLTKLLNDYARMQEQFLLMAGYEVTEQLNHMVSIFHLKELLKQSFNTLSGGQKTRVKLAATLLKKPDILLLDEPTNHLDIQTLEWLEVFLTRYLGTVVIISHDRYFLDRVVTKTILLDGGKCETFKGNYSFTLKERERLLLLEFEKFKTQQKKVEAMKAAIKRFREWGAKGDNEKFFKKAKELEQRLEKLELLENPKLGRPKLNLQFTGARTGSDVLVVEDFSLIVGDQLLFDEASVQIYVKEKVCMMGANGTGKTSFVMAAMGDNLDFDGKITLNPSAKIGYIPQEIRFEDEKELVLDAFRREYRCTEGEARNILAKYYFFSDDVFKRANTLSGGEKVLLKLAVLIQKEVNFLILDEPTNHIDIETREILEEALLDYKGTLLFISHDRYFINKVANKLIHTQDKKLISYNGNYAEYKRFMQDSIKPKANIYKRGLYFPGKQ